MSIELDHLGIAVHSIEQALRFYEQMLGVEVSHREIIESERVKVAMLPLGASCGSRIELLEATDADSSIAKFISKRGPGLHHVALRVDDLRATIERLKSEGARLLSEPRTGAGGHLYVFVHPASTNGILLELVQKMND
jgi:methylmalonyl-CoA epimerase